MFEITIQQRTLRGKLPGRTSWQASAALRASVNRFSI